MTSTTPHDDPGLDAQALDRLRELDPDGSMGVLAKVLRTFETSLVRELDKAAEAHARGDRSAVGDVAHKLKSSSAAVGASALSACCAEIDRMVRGGAPGDLSPMVETLLTEGQRALRAVRAILEA